jgi:hypothetical protein
MDLGAIEVVENKGPLDEAVASAFSRIRSAPPSTTAALVFDLAWKPTMAAVDVIARELAGCAGITTLTVVHPSAAMSFIASAIALRVPAVQVRAQRSVYDEEEDDDEQTDATDSRTSYFMRKTEALDTFIRRSFTEARTRRVRRFALVFEDGTVLSRMELSDLLAEELLNAGVEEIGLIHPSADLDTVAAAVQLRVPSVQVSVAMRPGTTRAGFRA